MMIYFTDAVLRAPTIGSMLMCMAAALVGSIVFLRKQSLLGESLSHATYPGVVLGAVVAGVFTGVEDQTVLLAICVMGGAFCSALLGLALIELLQRKAGVRSDTALCFILSAFFGIGLTLASQVQFSHSRLYRQMQSYIYGQAATMTDVHIFVYAALVLVIALVIILFYKELQVITFDRDYAKSLGISVRMIDALIFLLVVLAVVIGIRSVGVVLMSAMLMAPAVAARQYTNRFSLMLALAAFFGVFSGFMGNYLSVELSESLSLLYPDWYIALPTGPMIVLVASAICVVSLFVAPERGLLLRLWRVAAFRYRCVCENLLKSIWRHSPQDPVEMVHIAKFQQHPGWYIRLALFHLCTNGYLQRQGRKFYVLTHDGRLWAQRIVRLHRLWELYLVDSLGMGGDRVHRNAEEMEHIITPELEERLTQMLQDPKIDPHQQPIPPRDKLL